MVKSGSPQDAVSELTQNLLEFFSYVSMCRHSPTRIAQVQSMAGFVQIVITRRRVRRVGKERQGDLPIVKRP
jgi:hypothetical protein